MLKLPTPRPSDRTKTVQGKVVTFIRVVDEGGGVFARERRKSYATGDVLFYRQQWLGYAGFNGEALRPENLRLATSFRTQDGAVTYLLINAGIIRSFANPRENIRGGLASGRKPSNFPAAALRKGTKVELEHVVRPGKKPTKRDREIAREIAMDHLVENVEYYDYLEEAERRMSKKNRGAPPSKRWAQGAVKHPGKLGGKGFMSRPVGEQKTILDRCVRKNGYRSCLGSVMFLRNVSSSPAQKKKALKLQRYLQDQYGERPSRKNPDDGSWSAVVEILQGYRITQVRLTPAQQRQLSRMTG